VSGPNLMLVEALGLEDAVVIDRAEYDALPEHRRSIVTASPAGPGGGYAYVRLPDPPPVAALRKIRELSPLVTEHTDLRDVADAIEAIDAVVDAALAEFDGTSS
jgi:hypothetical protein